MDPMAPPAAWQQAVGQAQALRAASRAEADRDSDSDADGRNSAEKASSGMSPEMMGKGARAPDNRYGALPLHACLCMKRVPLLQLCHTLWPAWQHIAAATIYKKRSGMHGPGMYEFGPGYKHGLLHPTQGVTVEPPKTGMGVRLRCALIGRGM